MTIKRTIVFCQECNCFLDTPEQHKEHDVTTWNEIEEEQYAKLVMRVINRSVFKRIEIEEGTYSICVNKTKLITVAPQYHSMSFCKDCLQAMISQL